METKVARNIPEFIVDDMYIAMLEAEERLELGTANLRRCLNYLEESQGYKPPKGYRRNNDAPQI